MFSHEQKTDRKARWRGFFQAKYERVKEPTVGAAQMEEQTKQADKAALGVKDHVCV